MIFISSRIIGFFEGSMKIEFQSIREKMKEMEKPEYFVSFPLSHELRILLSIENGNNHSFFYLENGPALDMPVCPYYFHPAIFQIYCKLGIDFTDDFKKGTILRENKEKIDAHLKAHPEDLELLLEIEAAKLKIADTIYESSYKKHGKEFLDAINNAQLEKAEWLVSLMNIIPKHRMAAFENRSMLTRVLAYFSYLFSPKKDSLNRSRDTYAEVYAAWTLAYIGLSFGRECCEFNTNYYAEKSPEASKKYRELADFYYRAQQEAESGRRKMKSFFSKLEKVYPIFGISCRKEEFLKLTDSISERLIPEDFF